MKDFDKPFELRGGEGEMAGITNRINAIGRIEYLIKKKHGIDFRMKEQPGTLLKLWDLEMYNRYFKDGDVDKRIDELWCQRSADVLKELLDGSSEKIDSQEFIDEVENRIKVAAESAKRVTNPIKKESKGWKERWIPAWLR